MISFTSYFIVVMDFIMDGLKIEFVFFILSISLIGGAVAQSIERATPGEEVLGSIPAVAARSVLVGSLSL